MAVLGSQEAIGVSEGDSELRIGENEEIQASELNDGADVGAEGDAGAVGVVEGAVGQGEANRRGQGGYLKEDALQLWQQGLEREEG